MARVTIFFADGEAVSFEAEPDQSILSAAYKAGLPLAKDCEIGDCQTCRGRLLSGETSLDELAYITLEDDEIAEGAILNCVSMAESDVEIALPYVRASLIPVKKLRMKISAVEQLTASTCLLRADVSGPDELRFHPGQYVNICVPGTDQQRSFSMANGPGDPKALEFMIRILPQGAMSDYLRNGVQLGQSLDVTGPHGVFYLRKGTGPLVMVAGGTGLAPMVSILRDLVADGETQRRVTLCFGVNREDELFYLEELEALGRAFDRFELRVAVVEPGENWQGHAGFVTDAITPADIGQDACAYLCGPPPMVDAARQRLNEFGLDQDRVFAEEFQPSGT